MTTWFALLLTWLGLSTLAWVMPYRTESVQMFMEASRLQRFEPPARLRLAKGLDVVVCLLVGAFVLLGTIAIATWMR